MREQAGNTATQPVPANLEAFEAGDVSDRTDTLYAIQLLRNAEADLAHLRSVLMRRLGSSEDLRS